MQRFTRCLNRWGESVPGFGRHLERAPPTGIGWWVNDSGKCSRFLASHLCFSKTPATNEWFLDHLAPSPAGEVDLDEGKTREGQGHR